LSVFFLNSYMDFEDYTTPIKAYMEDRFIFKGVPGLGKQIKMYIKENTVELADSLLGFSRAEEYEFMSVDNNIQDLHLFKGGFYFEVFFMLDAQKETYTRVVFSFLDLFGKLGGVFELLNASLGLLIGFFAKNVLLFSMFKRLYHTEKEDELNRPNKEFSNLHIITNNNNNNG